MVESKEQKVQKVHAEKMPRNVGIHTHEVDEETVIG